MDVLIRGLQLWRMKQSGGKKPCGDSFVCCMYLNTHTCSTHQLTQNQVDKVLKQMLIINLSRAFGYWSVAVCCTFPRLIFSSFFTVDPALLKNFKCNGISLVSTFAVVYIFSSGFRLWVDSCRHLSGLALLPFFSVVS